jgi:hypothetical protein
LGPGSTQSGAPTRHHHPLVTTLISVFVMSSVSSSSSASNTVPTCDPAACTCLDLDTSSSSLHVAIRGVFVALAPSSHHLKAICDEYLRAENKEHPFVRARSVALNALRDLGNAHGHLVQDIKKLRTETEEPPSFLPPRVVVPAPAPAPAPVPVAAPALPAPVIPAVPEVPRLSVPELFQVLESTYQLALKTSARCEALNQGVSSYVRGTKRKLPFRLGEEGLV